MQRSRATRLGRAGLLLPLLLASACAAVPDPGSKPAPASARDYAWAQSLSGTQSAWPSDGWWNAYGDAQLDRLTGEGFSGSPAVAAASARFRTVQGLLAVAQLQTRAFTLDVQLVRALGGGFAIPDNNSAGGFAASTPQEQS